MNMKEYWDDLERYESGVPVETRQKIWIDLTMQVRESCRGMELEEQERQIRNEYLTVLKMHHDNRAIVTGLGRHEAIRRLGGRG